MVIGDQLIMHWILTFCSLQMMEQSIMEIMPQLIDNFNPDAWSNCLHGVIDGISNGLS